MSSARLLAWSAFGVLVASCVQHADVPAAPTEAELGIAPADFNAAHACVDWVGSTDDATAREHDAFPEVSPTGCYSRVDYRAGKPTVERPGPGCAYPDGSAISAVETRAAEEEVASFSGSAADRLPIELACELPEGVRRRAAEANARTLRSLASSWSSGPLPTFPYSVVGTFGFGEPVQDRSVLARWRPGDACIATTARDLSLLSVNVQRARRAAEAFHAGVAPVVTVSGGAVHSSVYEAFFLSHLVTCRFGVPADRVLVDPCADHTHTNIRNTGALVVAVGGRFAYLVTDDGIQSAYMEEWTGFDLLGGSIDQRALRDFGYLIGAWRRASVGMHAGFWYTPYRFWAGGADGERELSCMGDAAPE